MASQVQLRNRLSTSTLEMPGHSVDYILSDDSGRLKIEWDATLGAVGNRRKTLASSRVGWVRCEMAFSSSSHSKEELLLLAGREEVSVFVVTIVRFVIVLPQYYVGFKEMGGCGHL